MTKVTFSSLKLNKETKINTAEWMGKTIEVKQYLPIADRLQLIQNVINSAADHNSFLNPVKCQIFLTLEVCRIYGNITFTEKQTENPADLYDKIICSGFFKFFVNLLPQGELEGLMTDILDCGKALYEYKNSILGVMETASQDYSDLDMNADNIREKLADEKNLALLKDVMTKLG